MIFDEYWNSESLDNLRKKYPDMSGDEVRCIWNQAKANKWRDQDMLFEPPLSEKRIIDAGTSVLESAGFDRMAAVMVADDCWRAMLRAAINDGSVRIPNAEAQLPPEWP